MDIVQPSFGIRIRQLRLDRGLSQLELAEFVELSEDQISKIERGKSWVGEQTLALLGIALGVPQSSLFEYNGIEEFLRNGGLARRAPRKAPTLIVRHRRKALIKMPRRTK